MDTAYKVHLAMEIKGRIARCRASVRAAIDDGLRSIAVTAGQSHGQPQPSAKRGPSMRFYVYDAYRIFYQLDPRTRRVVVLDIGVMPAG